MSSTKVIHNRSDTKTSVLTLKIWITKLVSIFLSALCLTSCDNIALYFLDFTFIKGKVPGRKDNTMALIPQRK